MIKTVETALYLILASSLPLAIAQQQQDKDFPLRRITERELQRSDLPTFMDAVHTGDPYLTTAILQAGKSGDRFWVPYLMPILKKEHHIGMDNDDAGSAQLALAKLGEKEQLQEISCEANFGSSSIQSNAIGRKLNYVQGWFSISILAGWIDESRNQSQLLFDRPGDQVFAGPQKLALVMLPEIVPDPPPLAAPSPLSLQMGKLAPLRQAWREWINKNEESLRKLTPLGDGLDLSRSTCKRVLAHDRHFDRSNLQ